MFDGDENHRRLARIHFSRSGHQTPTLASTSECFVCVCHFNFPTLLNVNEITFAASLSHFSFRSFQWMKNYLTFPFSEARRQLSATKIV